MSRFEEINKIVDEIGDADTLFEFAEKVYDRDQTIANLQHRLDVAERALELACDGVKYFKEMLDREMGINDFFGHEIAHDLQGIIEQYKKQAEKEVKGE